MSYATIVLFIIALAIVAGLYRYSATLCANLDGVFPSELIGAQVQYAERTFHTNIPFPLVAKVDRVYRNGQLGYLMELKTRQLHQVYASDIIELSAQRIAVMEATRQAISDTGFITTLVDCDRKIHRVRLMSALEVEALYHRRIAIRSGSTQAQCAKNVGICKTCSYAQECRTHAEPSGNTAIKPKHRQASRAATARHLQKF